MTRSTRTTDTDEAPLTIRALIVAARGARTQRQYAAVLGIRQDLLSKYENGRVNPPTRIIEHCMRDVHIGGQQETPNATELARRVRQELCEAKAEPIRAAISRLLDVLAVHPRNYRKRAGPGKAR